MTARPVEWHDETRLHIEERFPQIRETYSLEAYLSHGKNSKKCHELGAQLIIEDSLDYARECVAVGVNVVRMDAPWNQGELQDGIVRVYSWKEVPQAVRKFVQ